MSGAGPEPRPAARSQRYLYKVMSSQMPRTFVQVEAASIEEAEGHGIVILLLGPAGSERR